MRCKACDHELSDFESTRKDEVTGQYLDLCNRCYKESGLGNIIPVTERFDLAHEVDVDVEEFDNEVLTYLDKEEQHDLCKKMD